MVRDLASEKEWGIRFKEYKKSGKRWNTYRTLKKAAPHQTYGAAF